MTPTPTGDPRATAGHAPPLVRLAQLENAVNWMTSCLGCAALLRSCYDETIRAETAERSNITLIAELAAVRRERDELKATVTRQGRR